MEKSEKNGFSIHKNTLNTGVFRGWTYGDPLLQVWDIIDGIERRFYLGLSYLQNWGAFRARDAAMHMHTYETYLQRSGKSGRAPTDPYPYKHFTRKDRKKALVFKLIWKKKYLNDFFGEKSENNVYIDIQKY